MDTAMISGFDTGNIISGNNGIYDIKGADAEKEQEKENTAEAEKEPNRDTFEKTDGRFDNITIYYDGRSGGMKSLDDIIKEKDLPSIDITEDLKSGRLKPTEIKGLEVSYIAAPPEGSPKTYGMTDMELYALFTGKAVKEPTYWTGPDGNTYHDCLNTTYMFNSDGSMKDMYKNDHINWVKDTVYDIIGSGLPNNIPTDKRIAEHFAGVAKRIDEAYASGKVTKDQYDNLNKLFEKSFEDCVSYTEKRRAQREWGVHWFNEVPYQERMLYKGEEYMKMREAEEKRLAETTCRIDRNYMMSYINKVRASTGLLETIKNLYNELIKNKEGSEK